MTEKKNSEPIKQSADYTSILLLRNPHLYSREFIVLYKFNIQNQEKQISQVQNPLKSD